MRRALEAHQTLIRSALRPLLSGPAVLSVLAVLWATSLALASAPKAVAVSGQRGVVVCAEEQAARAGIAALQAGGNATDAAVATTLALAVTWPEAGNLGGGGFWVSRSPAGQVTSIDFREVAPLAATADLYVKAEQKGRRNASLEGALASGVPGTVAGLYLAHQRAGRLPWARCVEPALRLARGGIPVTAALHRSLMAEQARLAQIPAAAAIFLPGGAVVPVGSTLVQADLADTLQRIARSGADGFYRGAVAARVVAWQRSQAGLITAEDLRRYRALVRTPVAFSFAGHQVFTTAPPSSGPILALMAGMLETLGSQRFLSDSVDTMHLMAEVERVAFRERNRFIADPDFVPVPVPWLLSPAHLQELVRSLPASPAAAEAGDGRRERAETTHVSVVDAAGGAVALTTTLNGGFGSGQVVPGAGFFMNNEMDDFSTRLGQPNLTGLVQGPGNQVAAGKRMTSSMCPTIAVKAGRVRLIWGTPGGSTIITTNLQLLWRVLLRGQPLTVAQEAPRFHQQDLPARMVIEEHLPEETARSLRALGHELERWPGIGWVNAIEVLDSGARIGVTDPRASGAALAEPGPRL